MLPGPYKDLTTSQNLAGLNSSTTNNSLIIVNKTNSMPPVLYKVENTDLVLYKNQNLLSTPVVNNRVLTDGANKIIRKQISMLDQMELAVLYQLQHIDI